jgi:hypothetical protein
MMVVFVAVLVALVVLAVRWIGESLSSGPARGYDEQGSRLALECMRSSPTGSTAATACEKQGFGSMIRNRNTP